MYFVIIGEDVVDSLPLRLSVRPAHLARLELLRAENRLLLAGPFPLSEESTDAPTGFSGSLIVADFPTLADCQSWANADPYVQAGVYARVTIKPFRKVMP
ncbi:MAG: YciI family protein [Magnetococcales bacterium]|nr:YciI family protein [Magnetococcales bacterium]NGZ04770.1 YciI family protein [Magnetococcales bacterium]